MSTRSTVFLEQRSYRRRRMFDALRILPFLGFALWMVPLLWPVPEVADGAEAAVRMSVALKYIFGIWLLMVAAAIGLWFLTRDPALPENANGRPAYGPQSEDG